MNKIWYKIVEKKGGQFKTLFHGVNKSRVIKTNEWLKADVKLVSDGVGTKYISGWHIADLKTLQDYITKFKADREITIVVCEAKNIWPKSHSRHDIYLSEYMKVIGEIT